MYKSSPIISSEKQLSKVHRNLKLLVNMKKKNSPVPKGCSSEPDIPTVTNNLKKEDSVGKLQAAGRRYKMPQNKSKQCSVCKFVPVV